MGMILRVPLAEIVMPQPEHCECLVLGSGNGGCSWPETTRLAILEALGRSEEAQYFRWACFERSLSADHCALILSACLISRT
jgi:hypothetical protein